MDNIFIKIEDTFEGYLWYSNQVAPYVFENGKSFIEDKECSEIKREFYLVDGQNPFIIEGKLYDKANNISYSIKYVDGKYIYKEYKVLPFDFSNTETVDNKIFLSNRMNGRYLMVLRYWKEEPDSLCEGMNVLTIEKNVFVGFKKKEE